MLFIILWSLEGGVRGWEEMDCTFPQPTMLGGVCVCVCVCVSSARVPGTALTGCRPRTVNLAALLSFSGG